MLFATRLIGLRLRDGQHDAPCVAGRCARHPTRTARSDAARRRTRRARSLGPVSLSTSRGRRSHRRQRRSARWSTPAPAVAAPPRAGVRVRPGCVAHRDGRSGWRHRRRGGRRVSQPPPRSPSRRTHRTRRAQPETRRRSPAQRGAAPGCARRTTRRSHATGWRTPGACLQSGTPLGTPPPPPARRRTDRRHAPPPPSRSAPLLRSCPSNPCAVSTAGTADYRAFRDRR